MDTGQLYNLFNRYLERSASPQEEKDFLQALADPTHAEDFKQWIGEHWESLKENNLLNKEQSDELYLTIQKAIQPKSKIIPLSPRFAMVRVFTNHKRTFKRIAVAASILLVIGFGTAALLGVFTNRPKQDIVKTQERFKNDVDPGTYKARLTLADGRIIILDSAAAGELAKQGNTVVLNKEGQLVYNTKGKSTEVLYNTLSTSKGETYSTVLADGSKVWLNAASSIKYPVAFTGNERKVEITGEAYFEVAKDTKKKFFVTGNGVTTEVLGTHFNVNAYNDETDIKVTLLEGSVRVTSASSATSAVKIKPGEQAVVTLSEVEVHHSPDLDEVLAWKNGKFYFKSADIETILRQAARWYDVEVVYDTKINTRFNGEVNRNVKLSDLLKAMELSGGVQFGIDGKKIIVKK